MFSESRKDRDFRGLNLLHDLFGKSFEARKQLETCLKEGIHFTGIARFNSSAAGTDNNVKLWVTPLKLSNGAISHYIAIVNPLNLKIFGNR
jgi:hypothetical protein